MQSPLSAPTMVDVKEPPVAGALGLGEAFTAVGLGLGLGAAAIEDNEALSVNTSFGYEVLHAKVMTSPPLFKFPPLTLRQPLPFSAEIK